MRPGASNWLWVNENSGRRPVCASYLAVALSCSGNFLLGIIVICMASLAPLTAFAAPGLPNGDRVLSYSVVEQDLRDVLAGIGEQLGLRTKISEHIRGKVHGRLPPAPASELLDRLAALYGLDWYYNAGTVFVSSHDETALKVIALGPVQFSDLADALEDLEITDKRWPIRVSEHGIALAGGPPDYLALVEQTFTALAKRPRDAEVRVLRGSVAGAP